MEEVVKAKPTNTSLVRDMHDTVMSCIMSGQDCVLVGVNLTLDGGIPSASMSKDENFDAVEVPHTAAHVRAWAQAMVGRLSTERKTFTGYEGKKNLGNCVLVQALSIVLKGGEHPCWTGMVLGDIRNAKIEARRQKNADEIAKNGGFSVDASLVPTGTKVHESQKSGALKDLYKRVFPSAVKAAKAFCRVVYGSEWYAVDKANRKATAQTYVVALREPVEEVQTETVAPVSTASVSKADLTKQAEALGMKVPKSWTKAKITAEVQARVAVLKGLNLL